MSVQYSAFGEMAVSVDGARQALARRRERGVLSVLLVAHGAPVAAERLLAEVWGDEESSLAPLQVAVSRLRNLIEPGRAARSGERLVSTAAGYTLRAATEDVDTWSFEARADAALAAGTPDERLAHADAARDLWCAAPYADVDAPSVRAEADRLEELLLGVHEVRARALVDLGRPEDAARALGDLASQHPYRERLWSLLALAQYQSARQADALETLRVLRERLAEDLGVDPSEEVRSLEQAVLQQDPALAATAPAAPPLDASPRPNAAPAATPQTSRLPVVEQVLAAHGTATDERRAAFVLVAGEAGIGKTHLVREVVARATAEGSRVVVGQCVEGEYAPALWPWLDIVRSLAGDHEVDPLLRPLVHDGPEAVDQGEGSTMRMFDAVGELLEASASERPLLVVLEDLHWADATSLLLLRHLAVADLGGVTVLCTRRTASATHDDRLVDAMAALARAGAERVRLDGLGTDAVRTLLEGAIGPHDPRLDEAVSEITAGNPFFVNQYARLLASTPDLATIDPTRLPVPDGVMDVLRQRLAKLPDEGVRLLASAAVLGGAVDPDRLAELTEVPVDTCLDLLDLAMASGLLVELDLGYAFVHALARETSYAGLTAARRMRLHDRAGRLAEARFADDAGAAAEIAHHAFVAAPLGTEQAERARTWLSRAAAVAESRHAHVEALELWRGVLAHAEPGTGTSATAHCGVAAALVRLGRLDEANLQLDSAVDIARRTGDWDTVAHAARALSGAGPWTWRGHGGDNSRFVDALTEALPHVAPAARARLLATLQVEYFYIWRTDKVDEYGVASIELARETGDQGLLREVLVLRLIVTSGSWDSAGRVAMAEELLALEPRGEQLVNTLFHLGHARWHLADPAGADAAMAECAAAAAELRHSGIEIPLGWWRAARARDVDDPRHRELIDVAIGAQRRDGYHSSNELESLYRTRSVPAGSPVEPETIAFAEASGMPVRAVVAHALLEAGQPEAAAALLGPPAPDDLRDYCSSAGRALRLLVLCETGTPDEIRAGLAPLEPYVGEPVSYGSIDHLGVVDHFVAAAYAALGDSRALDVARSAVELNRELGCAPWLRRSEALLQRLESQTQV